MEFDISDVLDKAISSTDEGITISEVSAPDQPLVYANGAFEIMSGYNREEIIGHNCRFLQGIDTEKEEVEKISNAIKNREACTVIFKNYKKDGKMFWNRLTVTPVSMPEAEKQYYVGVQCDITDIKEAEDDLIRQVIALEEKNKSINEMLQGFDKKLGCALYNAASSTKKLSDKNVSNDKELTDTLEKLKHATEEANDLVLNMRTAINVFGGVGSIRNIDLVNFKARRQEHNKQIKDLQQDNVKKDRII